MLFATLRKLLGLLVLGMAAAACSGEPEADSEHHAEHEDDFKGCPAEIPAFATGLTATADQVSVKVMSAEPAAPERYENNWVVELSPADAEIVRAQTFMPVHGHDGRVKPELRALEQPGQWAVERLNFTMRGPWEVRLWLSTATRDEENVVFQVCVAK